MFMNIGSPKKKSDDGSPRGLYTDGDESHSPKSPSVRGLFADADKSPKSPKSPSVRGLFANVDESSVYMYIFFCA
jgi:hypothetical protein